MPTPYRYERDDMDFCEECGNVITSSVEYVHGAAYCQEHAPLILTESDYDMIFDKAGVAGPARVWPSGIRKWFG